MKKTVLASILALSFTGAAQAGMYSEFQPEHQLDFSYAHFDADVDGEGDDSADGAFIEYKFDHRKSDYGLVLGVDSFGLDGFDTINSRLGLTYTYTVDVTNVDIVPELGLFHVDLDDEQETSYYYGLGVSTDLIPKTLYGKAYFRKYDLEDDSVWGDDEIGVQLSYMIDKYTSLEFGIKDTGILTRYTMGVGFRF